MQIVIPGQFGAEALAHFSVNMGSTPLQAIPVLLKDDIVQSSQCGSTGVFVNVKPNALPMRLWTEGSILRPDQTSFAVNAAQPTRRPSRPATTAGDPDRRFRRSCLPAQGEPFLGPS